MDKELLRTCVCVGLAAALGYGLFGKFGLVAVAIWALMRK